MSNTGYYGTTSGLVPMILGATAFTWLNAQLVISARPKLIESVFGLDRIFRFHSLMPLIAIAAAFIHKLLREAVFGESFKTQLGDAAIIIFIVVAVLGLVFLIDTLIRNIKPLKYVRDFAKKVYIGKYNIQKLMHNLVVFAVILVFIHVMLSTAAKNALVKSIFIAYFAIAMAFYLYHKVVMRYFLSHKFTVVSVTEDSPSMRTLTMRPDNGKIFKYLPGQFGFIRIQGDGISGEEHPFSITSEPTNTDTISMTIKNLGDWTADVLRVKPGSRALISAPYGRFSPLLYKSDKAVVLIAGGVGITPMLSILRYFYKNDKDRKVMLFWGVNSRTELINADEFSAFTREMKNFLFVPVIARELDYEGEKGYITNELIERIIKANDSTLHDAQYYVCGPAIMQSKIIKGLRSRKISKRHIHFESFSL
jgi:predicted ferric reductase